MSSRAQPRVEGTPTLKLPERYRIRRHLATGGMASVWCAEDLVLGRTVAIKVLAQRFAHDEVAVRRFKREARAAARVSNHAHVVTIYDVGDTGPDDVDPDAHGQAFIVMEHLTGGTVADALRVASINRREALRWLREAASALDHAHERGIVHRDIKPANFLLDGSRVLHVADFGIARLVSEDTITSTGELFGTAAYLAPEQALGRDATGASDRYALAVAAFELLTGGRPFMADHFAAQARQHIEDAPPSASERNRLLPAAVDPVLARGMAKDPEARYETAGAMVVALEDALSTPLAPSPRRGPAGRRHSTRRTVIGAGAGAGAVGAGFRSRRAAPAHTRGPSTPVSTPAPPTATHATTATTSAPIVAFEGRERGRGRAVALAALLVAVLAIAGVAIAGLGGSSHPAASRGAARAATSAIRHPAKPSHRASTHAASSSTTSTAVASAPPSTPTTSTPLPSNAQQLQLTGHQELISGNYEQAISTLRQAVSAAPPGSLTYAYALYDLGRSLTLSGDPAGAIPVLQQRLKIDNQTPVVKQALNQALRAEGHGATPSPSAAEAQPPSSKPANPAKPAKPAKPGKRAIAPPANSGGAGLGAPGRTHGRGHGDDG